MGFKQGDAVKIVQTLKPFVFCRGGGGRIEKIMKDGHVHFCVALDSPELQERVRLRNKNRVYEWHTELAWLRCRVSHIETVTVPSSIPGALASSARPSSLGKRKSP